MLPARLLWIATVLVTVALVVGRSRAEAQEELTDPVVVKLDQRVTRFLDSVAGGDESDAFADLLLGSQLVEQREAVDTLVDKSKDIARRYGAHRESEQLSAKRIGKDLVLLKYLYKCEKFPVIWYVAFYRDFGPTQNTTDDGWVVISVRFDTSVEQLFD